MKPLVSGAGFHNFETVPKFIGRYQKPVIREKDAEGSDDDDSKKKGAVIGYQFEDVDGTQVNVSNSALIRKAIEQVKPGAVLFIEFTGKGKNAKGQPVNRFRVDELEDADIKGWESTAKPDTDLPAAEGDAK